MPLQLLLVPFASVVLQLSVAVAVLSFCAKKAGAPPANAPNQLGETPSKMGAPDGKETNSKSGEVCDKCGSHVSGRKKEGSKKEAVKDDGEAKEKTNEEKSKDEKKEDEKKEEEKKDEENDEKKDNSSKSKKNSDKEKTKAPEKSKDISISPVELKFAQKGGMKQLIITNTTDKRLALKVKCSDNKLYRVSPVYGFCAKKGKCTVDVVRTDGANKLDKLVIATVECKDDCKDAAPLFKGKDAGEQLTNVPMNCA